MNDNHARHNQSNADNGRHVGKLPIINRPDDRNQYNTNPGPHGIGYFYGDRPQHQSHEAACKAHPAITVMREKSLVNSSGKGLEGPFLPKCYDLVKRYDCILTSFPSINVYVSATQRLSLVTLSSMRTFERMTPVTVSPSLLFKG